MRKRSLARDFALRILYQLDITARPIDHLIEDFWNNEEEAVAEEVKAFAAKIVLGVHEHLTVIDQKLAQYATNWQLKRMAVIDKNVMRMGVFELYYLPDIPPKVTINEAIDLAKKYGDIESGKFVNGILDKIHKTEIIGLNKSAEKSD